MSIRSPPSSAARDPTQTVTVSWSVSASQSSSVSSCPEFGKASIVTSELVSSSARLAMRLSASAGSVLPSSSVVTSLVAACHCWRSRDCSYRCAFSIAIPAAAASACTTTSSSSVKLPPLSFSVR